MNSEPLSNEEAAFLLEECDKAFQSVIDNTSTTLAVCEKCGDVFEPTDDTCYFFLCPKCTSGRRKAHSPLPDTVFPRSDITSISV